MSKGMNQLIQKRKEWNLYRKVLDFISQKTMQTFRI